MKIILLCAGYATRLYPLTKDQPKPLLPVGGRPILEWILDGVRELAGVEDIYVVTNHRFSGHFEEWRKSFRSPRPVHVINDQTMSNEDRKGAVGDLHYVLETKRIADADLLVIAGDNLFDLSLPRFVEEAKGHGPHASIAVFDVRDKQLARQYGLVRTGRNNQVIEFLEKPKDPPTTLASCGLYWLPAPTRVLLDRYLREGHNADQPGHYMRWLAETDRLFAVRLEGRWLDIGDLASYDKANQHSSEFRKIPS